MQHAAALAQWRTAGEPRREPIHGKTHALAVEWLNDGEALFPVWLHPELPLTHNEAERALRHGVIRRTLRLGTRPAGGSRVVALLASVIDTGRPRGPSPWRSLQRAMPTGVPASLWPPCPSRGLKDYEQVVCQIRQQGAHHRRQVI